MPTAPPSDLRALGAQALTTSDLLRLLLGPRADDVDDAAAALALHPRAREAALLELPSGPRLLAAVELGRRAWMQHAPVGARVVGPTEVASIAARRLVDDEHALVLALDVRSRVARIREVDDDVSIVQEILLGGCRRGVWVKRVARAAVPKEEEVDVVVRVRQRASLVGVVIVDGVLLGDDGFCSLLRLGLIGPPQDARYS